MLVSKTIAITSLLLLAPVAALACDDYAEEQALAAAIAAAKAQRLATQPAASSSASDRDAAPGQGSLAALAENPVASTTKVSARP